MRYLESLALIKLGAVHRGSQVKGGCVSMRRVKLVLTVTAVMVALLLAASGPAAADEVVVADGEVFVVEDGFVSGDFDDFLDLNEDLEDEVIDLAEEVAELEAELEEEELEAELDEEEDEDELFEEGVFD